MNVETSLRIISRRTTSSNESQGPWKYDPATPTFNSHGAITSRSTQPFVASSDCPYNVSIMFTGNFDTLEERDQYGRWLAETLNRAQRRT